MFSIASSNAVFGFARAVIGGREIGVGRDAARVVVLHDHRGRRGELEREAERGVEVEDVVVREQFAAEDFGAGDRRAIRGRRQRRARVGVERRALVRVLAVAELVQPLPLHAEGVG